MSIVEDLLEPFAGENPAGKDVTYENAYSEITRLWDQRTAGPQYEPGEPGKPLKIREAEPISDLAAKILDLATKILSEESKDLSVGLFLAGSLLDQEGFAGLRSGLDVVHGVLDRFWEHAFPEEEADRVDLLDFLDKQVAPHLAFVPLTDGGHNLFHYEEYQQWAALPEGEKAKRKNKKSDEPDAGDFEEGFRKTSKARYKAMVGAVEGCHESLTKLVAMGEERFTGKIKPHYRNLKAELERTGRALDALLSEKLETEPDRPGQEEGGDEETGAEAASDGPASTGGNSPDPTSLSDASQRIGAIARFLRQTDPTNPAAYLLLRGFRWGEIRAHGAQVDVRMLDAPATDVRKRLKTLLLNEDWENLLEAGEEVTASPSGRGWLDLQRYIMTALEHLGSTYAPAADAVRGQLAALLHDIPDLPQKMLMDDTPAANRDTLEWLALLGLDGKGGGAPATPDSGPDYDQERTLSEATYEKALEWVASGSPRRGIELLMKRSDHEKSERARFITETLAASVMLDAGMHDVAKPILKDLEATSQKHNLDEWEAGDLVARPLALLYKCLPANDALRAQLYDRICLLDPTQAMSLTDEAPPTQGVETIEQAKEIEDAPGVDPGPSDEG